MDIPTVNLLQVGVIHTCEICRQVFKPRSILQKSCGSKQCQKDLHNLARRKRMQQGEFSSTRYRTCESCSVEYEAKNRDTNSRTCKNCSTEKLRYKPKVTKNCLWCNKEFITSRPSQEKYCPKQKQLNTPSCDLQARPIEESGPCAPLSMFFFLSEQMGNQT